MCKMALKHIQLKQRTSIFLVSTAAHDTNTRVSITELTLLKSFFLSFRAHVHIFPPKKSELYKQWTVFCCAASSNIHEM
jgi:hypothetical protein